MGNATSTSGLAPWVTTVLRFFSVYAFELILIGLILFICISRGLRLGVTIHDPEKLETSQESALSMSALFPLDIGELLASITFTRNDEQPTFQTNGTTPKVMNVSLLNGSEERSTAIAITAPAPEGYDDFNSVAITDDPAPHINNLTLVLSPDYARRKKLPAEIVKAKRERVQRYLDAFAPIAQAEMQAYGVPASITLAQGLLESNAGDSKLARQSKNHFGIKCRSKCLGCTCRNYGDDTRYDMFRVFEDVAESFREHSILLSSHRYKKLHRHGSDYKKWAHGLKACGYATDKRYANKLIQIIETLNLDQYDGGYAA